REEIDITGTSRGRGANFGWNACEGTLAYPGPGPCTLPGATAPWFDYAHTAGSCGSGSGTVIGGYVVRDPALEELYGRYVYADYCRGFMHSVAFPPGPPNDTDTGVAPASVVGFGED